MPEKDEFTFDKTPDASVLDKLASDNPNITDKVASDLHGKKPSKPVPKEEAEE